MNRFFKRVTISIVIGTVLTVIIGNGQRMPVELVLLFYLWSLGSAFAFEHHVGVLLRMLDPGLKLSVISFLTFRNGFMGSAPILIYATYCLLFGWVYGMVLFVIQAVRLFL